MSLNIGYFVVVIDESCRCFTELATQYADRITWRAKSQRLGGNRFFVTAVTLGRRGEGVLTGINSAAPARSMMTMALPPGGHAGWSLVVDPNPGKENAHQRILPS